MIMSDQNKENEWDEGESAWQMRHSEVGRTGLGEDEDWMRVWGNTIQNATL